VLVLVNFSLREGAYGGANAFLRTLTAELRRRGVQTTADRGARADVALLNALTDGLELDDVRSIADRGIPVVHRKTGYRGRGAPGLRQVVGGVVVGDAHQVAFDPWVAHTVFQSRYSRDVFAAAGHRGPSSVIVNGVDPAVFSPAGHAPRRPGEPWRVVVSSWSSDENKGYPEYRRIDAQLGGMDGVELTLVGRPPAGTRFAHVRVLPPQPPAALAATLRGGHVVLQLARWETCSNALLEGMACGLPAVYLDSGANAEIAGPYGVAYDGRLAAALEELEPRYEEIAGRLREQPFRIGPVADRYVALLEAVAARTAPPAAEEPPSVTATP
jgi:glycosyltransferase involved in cell wall biosynthesis